MFAALRMRANLPLLLGGAIVGLVLVVALFHPWLTPYGPEQMDMRNRLSLPSAAHPLGTDNFGRDLWTRIAHGSAISVSIALGAVGTAMVVGSLVGLLAGYFGGWIDHALMRLVDLFLGFPALILAMALVAVLGTGAFNVAIFVAFSAFIANPAGDPGPDRRHRRCGPPADGARHRSTRIE